MPDPNLTRLIRKNLLFSIQAAEGSDLFRHVYVRDKTGREFDALNDGELSCALVVSGLLALHSLIDRPHSTVVTTLTKMAEAGWQPTDAPHPGDIAHWPADSGGHRHLGFYIDTEKYLSNSMTVHHPVIHGQTLSDGRKPDGYYTHSLLSTG